MEFQIPRCPICHTPLEIPWVHLSKTSCGCCGRELELVPELLTTLRSWTILLVGAIITGYYFTNALDWADFQDHSLHRLIADILIALVYYMAWRYVYFLKQYACLPKAESGDFQSRTR